MTKKPPNRDTSEGARQGWPQTKADKSAGNAAPHTSRSNRWEKVPGDSRDTPWPRTPRRVALPLGPAREPGEKGGSRRPMGPWIETPVTGDWDVGAELGTGGRGWTIPKCTYENRLATLPVKVGSGPCGGEAVNQCTVTGLRLQKTYQTARPIEGGD